MRLLVCVALLLVVVGVSARPEPNPFCQDPAKLHFCSVLPGQGEPLPPPIPDSDIVEIYSLAAPIWEFLPGVGNITKELHLIHNAIGAVLPDGREYSFEFEGLFESPNASFPYIVPDKNVPGGNTLIECNGGAVCWDATIDWSYYTVRKALVGRINGTVFNKLMAWIPMDNSTDSVVYETFRVMDEWKDGTGHTYMESYTCDDYAWKVFGILKGWGMETTSNITTLERVFLNFYVGDNKPVKANMSDPQVFQEVVQSFAKYDVLGKANQCAKESDEIEKIACGIEVFDDLFRWLEEPKYFLYDNDYYYLDQVQEEGLLSFDWKYELTPIKTIYVDDAALAEVVHPVYRKYFA